MKHLFSSLTIMAFAIILLADKSQQELAADQARKKPFVTEKKDDFENASWIIMRDQPLVTNTNATYNITLLKETKKGSSKIQMRLTNSGTVRNTAMSCNSISLFHIEKGELVLLIDGERVSYRATGNSKPESSYVEFAPQSANNWVGHRDWSYWGNFFYDLTPDQLKKISDAKDVRIKATDGGDLAMETKLLPANITDFKQFYDQYVMGNGTVSNDKK